MSGTVSGFFRCLSAGLAALIAVSLLHGCNSEVFVDDFMPEDVHFSIGNGESVTVLFSSDAWGVLSVSEEFGKGRMYDFDGNYTGRSLPLGEEETAVVRFTDGTVSFRIERRVPSELVIVAEDMADVSDRDVEITVGNEFESGVLYVEMRGN